MMEENEYKARYDKFLDIVIEEMFNLVGNHSDITFECDKNGINILVRHSNVLTFFIKDDCFLLSNLYNKYSEIKLSNLNSFREVVSQLIISILIPEIYGFYKNNYIQILPSRLKIEDKEIDFSKITIDWLIKKFHEITEDCMNGETIENVIINQQTDGISIGVSSKSILIKPLLLILIEQPLCKPQRLQSTSKVIKGSGVESGLKKEIEKLLDI